MPIDPCSSCGYIAAFVSCVCFGSFGVPLKATKSVDVDPLVFQSYKTFMCLSTSLALLMSPGIKFSFTPVGIVSGLFWVPAGVAHICGMKTAGLAIAQGTCSSIIVMVSFSWGLLAFHERVYSVSSACFAAFLMICGICGMSFYASDAGKSNRLDKKDVEMSDKTTSSVANGTNGNDGEQDDQQALLGSPIGLESTKGSCKMAKKKKIVNGQPPQAVSFMGEQENEMPHVTRQVHQSQSASTPLDVENALPPPPEKATHIEDTDTDASSGAQMLMVTLSNHLQRKYNVSLTPAQLGLTCSALSGVWGGSVMVPLHFAGAETKGLNYVFSFAVGATIVNLLLWAFRFLFHYHRTESVSAAYCALPSFHVNKMLLSGCSSGLLWSIGNMASIISVTHLGEGVGYSLTQSSMLVSGLFGIFYFHEIRNRCARTGWFLSATISLAGIVMLSSQHMPMPMPVVHKT